MGGTDARQLQADLKQVIRQHPKKIIVLTHVPPFKETCLHMGDTHSKAKYQSMKNLMVETGKAKYYQAEVQKIILV